MVEPVILCSNCHQEIKTARGANRSWEVDDPGF
jgi:hypothetical protein